MRSAKKDADRALNWYISRSGLAVRGLVAEAEAEAEALSSAVWKVVASLVPSRQDGGAEVTPVRVGSYTKRKKFCDAWNQG